MPVIPSFSGYAPKPDLAGAYTESRRINLAEQQAAFSAIQAHRQLQQQAAEAQQRLQLGQQQLQQQRQIAEMETSARAAVQQQDNLRRQQELEIDKAYKGQLIGLREGELKQQQAMDALKVIEASRKFMAQRKYQQLFQEYGGDQAAAQKAMMQVGPEAGFESGAYSSLFKTPQARPLIPPNIIEQGGQQFGQYEEGERFYPLPQSAPDVTARMVWSKDLDSVEDEIKTTKKFLTDMAEQGYSPSTDTSEMTARRKAQVQETINAKAKLEELETRRANLMKSAPTRASAPEPTSTGTNAVTRLRYNSQTKKLEPVR